MEQGQPCGTKHFQLFGFWASLMHTYVCDTAALGMVDTTFPSLIRTPLNQFHRAWADYGRGQGSARWPFLQIAAEHLNSGDDEAKHRRRRARALAVMVSSSDSPLGPAGLLLSHRDPVSMGTLKPP